MTSDIAAGPDRVPSRSAFLPAILLLGAQLPFLLLHLWNLWRYRPHYEFFPLVLAIVAWLVWQRWPREQAQHTLVTRWASWLLLLAGLMCLAASVLLFSPWAGAVAAVFTTGGLLVHYGGRAAVRDLLPVWLLLWIIVPPPWRLDDEFIRALQSIVSRASSVLLDWLHVGHVRAGNVFRLPDRELFVAEACSGVNSQLVLIAISVLLVILFRRTVLHAVLLVAAAVVWSTVINVVRVSLIVLAAAQWGIDLSSGWQHQVLGYLLVLLGLGMLQLLSLAAPQPPEVRAEGLVTVIYENWLPNERDGWQRVDFTTEEREATSDLGQFSKRWTYQRDGQTASVSVDLPFVGWHELTRCYEATGWSVERRTVRRDSAEGPVVEALLTKPTGEAGYLLFSLYDGAANPVQPRTAHGRGVQGKIANNPLLTLLGLRELSASPVVTTLQIQQFIPTAFVLSEAQRGEAYQTYLKHRQQIVARWSRSRKEE